MGVEVDHFSSINPSGCSFQQVAAAEWGA